MSARPWSEMESSVREWLEACDRNVDSEFREFLTEMHEMMTSAVNRIDELEAALREANGIVNPDPFVQALQALTYAQREKVAAEFEVTTWMVARWANATGRPHPLICDQVIAFARGLK